MKYLIELLKDENTVIIPGLGALTVVNRNPLDLKFMSYLKFNDGTLVKFIAQQEGIEQDDAKAKIDAFVAEVTAVLEQGKSYEIQEVGVLSKDASGDIQITSQQIEDAVAEEIVAVSETIIEEKQEQIEEEVTPIIEEPEIIEPIVEEIEATTVEPEKIEEKIEVVAEQVEEKTEPIMTTSVEENSVKATEEDQWNDDLDLPPLNYQPERPKSPILEKTKKDKKPRNYKQLLWLFVALLIVGGASYVGFNYKDLKESIPFLASKKEVGEPKEEIQKEETQKEKPVESTNEPTVEPEIVVAEVEQTKEHSTLRNVDTRMRRIVIDKSLPIQVIVGSFGEESNANRMVDKLTAQGFNASVVGVYGGLHTVSVGSFNSMDDFRANQSQFDGAGKYWVKK